MKRGEKMQEMMPFWFAGGDDYDVLCQNFRGAIQGACKAGSTLDEPWRTTVDGKMAQIIMFDQLSRNAFRGTDEAFQYDDAALDIARDMSQMLISTCQKGDGDQDENPIILPTLSGEVYTPYLQFFVSPLMHSEALDDHTLALQVCDFSAEVVPKHMTKMYENVKQFELEHKDVIDRFGRYPHRNAKLGRKSTPEELEWLSNEDELPGWAKSQG